MTIIINKNNTNNTVTVNIKGKGKNRRGHKTDLLRKLSIKLVLPNLMLLILTRLKNEHNIIPLQEKGFREGL